MTAKEEVKKGLTPYISPAAAWAFAVGTSVGWGSLVITCTTYLAQAGPAGTALGLIAGGLIMLLVSRNYHYMMNCFPNAGGAYGFTKEVFGHDHGFLNAWFLMLTYLAMFWANATSLPLFARYFLGETFHVGRMYSLFGYDVYLGEALLGAFAILAAALFCAKKKKAAAGLMLALVLVFTAGILLCTGAAAAGHGAEAFRWEPFFLPEKSAISQIIRIACISPWAFIGFESISHGTEEFTFPLKKSFRVLAAAVAATTMLYILVTVLSVSVYPAAYGDWISYIRDLSALEGIDALPPFYGARHYLGNAGTGILMVSLFALIVTSLIGNIQAVSRLFYAMAQDRVLPEKYAVLGKDSSPDRAIALIALVSLPFPFLGRTAIGWIVDVTTIGATIIYGFVSAAALKTALDRGDETETAAGAAGVGIMVFFILYILLPNFFTTGSLEPETYILFTLWAIGGFLFFRRILKRDPSGRFGKSIIVWIGLLTLVLFTSLVWMSQTTISTTGQAMEEIQSVYGETTGDAGRVHALEECIAREMRHLRMVNARSMFVVISLFGFSLFTLFGIYSLMRKRAEESERELGNVRAMANRDPLTGVKSKHAWAEAERDLNEKIGRGEAEAFSVVVCDVNGLKFINDTYGHKAGDEYIRKACRMVCEIFRHSPVFRTGGDEFVVILSGHDYEYRTKLMELLHTQSLENIGKGDVVVSGGCSDYIPGEDRELHAVFERADALMYAEKKELKALGAKTR